MKAFLINKVEEKPTITLRELKKLIEQNLQGKARISTQTISRCLEGELISLKDLHSIPLNWNQSEVKEERFHFMTWLMSAGINRT